MNENKTYLLGFSKGFTAYVGSDSSSLSEYWELGWEIGGSRIILLKDLLDQKISKDSTIVTLKDRMFLYDNIFPNVKAYEDKVDNTIWDTRYCDYNFIEPKLRDIEHNPNYKTPEMINLIKKTGEVKNMDSEYYVIHYRQRPHGGDRNIDNEAYRLLISSLDKKGIKYIVYGKNSKNLLENRPLQETSLSDANAFLKGINCLGLIGPVSGGSMIALLSCNSNHHIIDSSHIMSHMNTKTHPLYHGNGANFSDGKIHYYNNIKKFLETNNLI